MQYRHLGCMVTGVPLIKGEPVMVVLLAGRQTYRVGYSDGIWRNTAIPFYGEYDGHMGVTGCYGDGLEELMNSLRTRLYRFGEGWPPALNPSVNAQWLTPERIFDAASFNRLGIEYDHQEFAERLHAQTMFDELTEDQLYEQSRLLNFIKSRDIFCPVMPAIISMTAITQILNDYTVYIPGEPVGFKAAFTTKFLNGICVQEACELNYDCLGFHHAREADAREDAFRVVWVSLFLSSIGRGWVPNYGKTGSDIEAYSLITEMTTQAIGRFQ